MPLLVSHRIQPTYRIDLTVPGTNVQTFAGALGGAAPPITESAGDRPFTVNGNTFTNIGAALQRSCDIQNNACFNAANSGALSGGTAQCQEQLQACKAASNAKRDNIPSIFKRQNADDNADDNANADASTDAAAATGTNIQAFSGNIGGAAPRPSSRVAAPSPSPSTVPRS